jgi:hypothetical protein
MEIFARQLEEIRDLAAQTIQDSNQVRREYVRVAAQPGSCGEGTHLCGPDELDGTGRPPHCRMNPGGRMRAETPAGLKRDVVRAIFK